MGSAHHGGCEANVLVAIRDITRLERPRSYYMKLMLKFLRNRADNIRSLADKPVVIKIRDPSRGGMTRTGSVQLHRSERTPAIFSRSFLTDISGRAAFYGWMPVNLSNITVTFDDTETVDVALHIRELSYIELAFRLFFFSPKTVVRALRLLAVGNLRGFQFRIVRLLDSMIAPRYSNWRRAEKLHRTPINPHDATTRVVYSIDGSGDAAESTRRSMQSQSYRNLKEIPLPVQRADLQACDADVWLRIPAGITLDIDYVARMLEPLQHERDIVAVYCDEEYFDGGTRSTKPFFKPAFNSPLSKSGWLAPDAALVRVDALSDTLNLASDTTGDVLFDLSQTGRIAHIPVPLFCRPAQRVLPPPPLKRQLAKTYRVSVVIPTRDRADLLTRCLQGLFKGTSHAELDVLIIDNDSRDVEALELMSSYENKGLVRRLLMPGKFNFSKACNAGVAAAKHELILLLNNDVEPLHSDWLGQMAQELESNSVGACGALLLFPDGFIQHGGVTLGMGSVARHTFHFKHPSSPENLGLIERRREVSAVTAACLLTRKSLWVSVDGMNEDALPVAFNDVDYCLKLLADGKKIIWTPHARLTHLESVSRQSDDTPEKMRRFASEEKYMHDHWAPLLQNDPYYNPNLSLFGDDYVIDATPRDRGWRTTEQLKIFQLNRRTEYLSDL